MTATALSSRARTLGRLAAAVVTTVVATLAIAGAADAAGTTTSSAEPPRIEISSVPSCDNNGIPFTISFSYDDLADGHVPQAVHEELVEGSTVVWTRDDLYQEFGNYFNVASYPPGGAALNQTAIVTYSVTITYDDGVTQTQSTTLDVATARCVAPPADHANHTNHANHANHANHDDADVRRHAPSHWRRLDVGHRGDRRPRHDRRSGPVRRHPPVASRLTGIIPPTGSGRNRARW